MIALHMTFRTKLILWLSGLLMIVILLFGVTVYSLMDRTLVDAVDRALADTVNLVTNSSRVRLVGEFGAPTERRFVLPKLDLFRASGVEVQVWSVDMDAPRLEASSINIRDLDTPLDETTLGQTEPVYTNVQMNGRQMRVLTSPMYARGELLANVQAVAVLDTINDARERLLLVMSVGGAAAVGVSVLVGMWLSRRALRPIRWSCPSSSTPPSSVPTKITRATRAIPRATPPCAQRPAWMCCSRPCSAKCTRRVIRLS